MAEIESLDIKRKNEIRGRIGFIVLCLIPVITIYILAFDKLGYKIVGFIIATVLAIVANRAMSRKFRKDNPIIKEKSVDELMKNRDFNPAMISRVITLSVSVIGGIVLAWVMSSNGIIHPIMFFLIGYVYFAMIQFRRL